jgi:Kinesin motor domain
VSTSINNSAELEDLITNSLAHRRMSATNRNAASSRSHALLTIRVKNTLLPYAEEGQLILVEYVSPLSLRILFVEYVRDSGACQPCRKRTVRRLESARQDSDGRVEGEQQESYEPQGVRPSQGQNSTRGWLRAYTMEEQ